MKTNITTTYLGLILLFLFGLQLILDLPWAWLAKLQANQDYKRWSGLAVTLLLVFQWLLSLFRTKKNWRKNAQKMLNAHKWVGALTPVIFYAHAMQAGYGYLALLTYVFLANTLLGYLNLETLKNNSEILFKGWMITHVALSSIISILVLLHIGMVFYYK